MDESLDRVAGYKLLQPGALVNFDVVDAHIESLPDGGFVRIQFQLGEIDEDGERAEDHE
jgi:hypothetical protein